MQPQQQPSHSVLPLPAAPINSDEAFLIGCAERAQAEGDFQQRDQLLQLLAVHRTTNNTNNSKASSPSSDVSPSPRQVSNNNSEHQQHRGGILHITSQQDMTQQRQQQPHDHQQRQQQHHQQGGILNITSCATAHDDDVILAPRRPLSPNSRQASSMQLLAMPPPKDRGGNADSLLGFRVVTNDNDNGSTTNNSTTRSNTQEGSSRILPSDFSRRSFCTYHQPLAALESLISDHGFSSAEEALANVQQRSAPIYSPFPDQKQEQQQQNAIIVQHFCAAATELFLVDLLHRQQQQHRQDATKKQIVLSQPRHCATNNKGPLYPEHGCKQPTNSVEILTQQEPQHFSDQQSNQLLGVPCLTDKMLAIPIIETASSNTTPQTQAGENNTNNNNNATKNSVGDHKVMMMSISSVSIETAKVEAMAAASPSPVVPSPTTQNLPQPQRHSASSSDGAQLSIATFPVMEATRGTGAGSPAVATQARASTTRPPRPFTKPPPSPTSRSSSGSLIAHLSNKAPVAQQQQHNHQQDPERKTNVSSSDTSVVTTLDRLERSLSIFNASNPNVSVLVPMERSESAVRVARKARQSSSSFGCWCINGYAFVEQLGKGGQGSVWKALDQKASEETGRDKFVAIKIVPRQKLQKQNRTANLFGPLAGHPSDTDFDMPCFTGSLTERPPVVGRNNSTVESSPLGAGMSALKHAYAGGPATDTSLNLIVEMVVGLIKHESLLGVDEIIDDPKSEYVLLVSRLLDGPPARIVEGGDLDMGALAPLTVARYAHNIASALEQLHSCGIVHCDIKLDNMLVDKARNRLVLGDFGLAAVQQGECVVLGGGNGTPAFWAPELFQRTQHRHPVAHTKESDCYSLGVCLFTLLFGRFPYWTEQVRDLKSWRAVMPGAKQEMVVLPSVWSGPHATKTLAEPGQREAFGRLRIVIEQLLHPVPSKRMAAASIVKWTEVLLQRLEQ